MNKTRYHYIREVRQYGHSGCSILSLIHFNIQASWNKCLHGVSRTDTDSSNSSKQMQHPLWVLEDLMAPNFLICNLSSKSRRRLSVIWRRRSYRSYSTNSSEGWFSEEELKQHILLDLQSASNTPMRQINPTIIRTMAARTVGFMDISKLLCPISLHIISNLF